jgi:hypothetical protein
MAAPADTLILALSPSVQLLLLVRCLVNGCWRQYPFFFALVVYNLGRTVALGFLLYLSHPAYGYLFWPLEMASDVLCFGVAWEVFRHLFPRGSVLRRIAGTLLLATLVLLAAVFSFFIGLGTALVPDVVRKVSITGAVWLYVNVAVARYYNISLSRNLMGMSCGLGIMLALAVMNIAVVEMARSFALWFYYIVSACFIAGVLIWIWATWVYTPMPRAGPEEEADAQKVLALWDESWRRIRSTFGKVTRP